MLQNPIYRGEIVHKDKSYPGQHAAIVDQGLWDKIQTRLAANRVGRAIGGNAQGPSLLAGPIFDAGGEPMTPTHASKKGRRYRYYVSHSLIKRGRPKASDAACRAPAGEMERLVEERIVYFLKDEGAPHEALSFLKTSSALTNVRVQDRRPAKPAAKNQRFPRWTGF